jgi:hypothetical protein
MMRKILGMHNARITANEVLAALDLLMTADIRSIYDENGVLKPIQDWPPEMVFRLNKVESREIYDENTGALVGYIRKVFLANKLDVQALAMRHFGLLDGQATAKPDDGNLDTLTDEELAARRAHFEAQRASVEERRARLQAVAKGPLRKLLYDSSDELASKQPDE